MRKEGGSRSCSMSRKLLDPCLDLVGTPSNTGGTEFNCLGKAALVDLLIDRCSGDACYLHYLLQGH